MNDSLFFRRDSRLSNICRVTGSLGSALAAARLARGRAGTDAGRAFDLPFAWPPFAWAWALATR